MLSPITGNDELDTFLFNLVSTIEGTSSTSVTPPVLGDSLSYVNRYIHIKYGTDNLGTGFSDVPTGANYWGLLSSDSLTESTNPTDYTWSLVSGGFGSTAFLYYQVLGARHIKFAVDSAPPSYKWVVEAAVPIDLDNTIPDGTVTSVELVSGIIDTPQLAPGAVTASKTALSAISNTTGALTINSVGTTQVVASAITAPKTSIAAINSTTGALTTDSVDTIQIKASAVTAPKTSLSAINSTTGALTTDSVGTIQIQANAVDSTKTTGYSGTVTTALLVGKTITIVNGLITGFA